MTPAEAKHRIRLILANLKSELKSAVGDRKRALLLRIKRLESHL